ncbi:MAG TPA: N-6 DNA methylase [Armatimonadota bacterium]|jgi:type I restriction enzyme M protein
MTQLENIEAIERRLWSAADQLRANSNLASNEYFMPVMGLIFLRHAYSRFLAVKPEIEKKLPSRGGVTRPLTKEDFSERSAIFLRPEAQFDYLVANADNAKLSDLVVSAMESIEQDYKGLEGVLPKQEYQELDYAILGNLLRTLNPEALKRANGDIFGRIYEYFLTQFADQGAHDGGEFFTPISLVSFIANVLEPKSGIVADPACGSGGMFVQSAHIVERNHENPAEKLTFRGYEKNKTTANLAKMNLAVHGLEGTITSGNDANSYYNDPQNLLHACDYVMANPPFNVDEVDADKVKNDPRITFGLPGVNKGGKVSNANYLWIQYFYSYMNESGRAGFVMSSQSSSAGRDEAKVRQRLVETGHVDIMVSIRSNFFYTRSVPCELWFFDKAKSSTRTDAVLMLDARSIFRQVTRKICDFSPEQLQNLLAIVWLYRGERARFLELVEDYLRSICTESAAVPAELAAFDATLANLSGHFDGLSMAVDGHADPEGVKKQDIAGSVAELCAVVSLYKADEEELIRTLDAYRGNYAATLPDTNDSQHAARVAFSPIAEAVRGLVKQVDLIYKLAARVTDMASGFTVDETISWAYDRRGAAKLVKRLDADRKSAVEQLKRTNYFYRQVAWLQDRFPDAELVAVPGLVTLANRAQIEAADWSLTPGRYVGVASVEEDDDFDFEQTVRDIHVELADLNKEAAELAAQIQVNIEELGV